MRTFTEVGRQVELHCTGVGKAMLTQLSDADIDAIVRRVGLTGYTPTTLTTPAGLHEVLTQSRAQGYVLDEQEQEAGVRCVAVPVVTASGSVLAVSISGPMQRVTDELVSRAAPLLQDAARRLAGELESVAGH
jgi:IclR family acetate operon transcriptional repressor